MVDPIDAARRRIGTRLREVRKQSGLSGPAFALRAGWDPARVSDYENGHKAPLVPHIRQWCEIAGASDQVTEDLIAATSAFFAELRAQWMRAPDPLLLIDGQKLGRIDELLAAGKLTDDALIDALREAGLPEVSRVLARVLK